VAVSAAVEPSTKVAVARRFNRHAETYDLYADVQRRMAARIAAAAADGGPPQRILEVGCGTGYLTSLLRDDFPDARITAVDLAERMVDQAHRRLGRSSRVELDVADVEAVEWPPEVFDLVVSNATLQWLATPEETLAKLAKALRPAGRMLHATFGPATFQELHSVYRGLEEELGLSVERHGLELAAPDEWVGLLTDAGLASVRVREQKHRVEYASCRGFLEAVKRTGAGYSPAVRSASGLRLPIEVMRRYDRRFRAEGGVYATFHVLELAGTRR
jgi:malonyl-CoA O-methyltransferase